MSAGCRLTRPLLSLATYEMRSTPAIGCLGYFSDRIQFAVTLIPAWHFSLVQDDALPLRRIVVQQASLRALRVRDQPLDGRYVAVLGYQIIARSRELASDIHHEACERLEGCFEAVAVGLRRPDIAPEIAGVRRALCVRSARVVRERIRVVRAFVRI